MICALCVALVNGALARPAWSLLPLLLVAAAAFLLARYYTPDPYYAPALRRVSDGGMFGAAWIYGWVGAAVAASALTLRSPRLGSFAGAVVLLGLSTTAWASAVGH